MGLLQAYYQKHAKHPEIFEFLDPIFCRMPVDKIVTQLQQAEIVFFSVYIWNFRISVEIARCLKKKKLGVMIIFGGPNIPVDAEKLLKSHPFINIACHGEGEEVVFNILENYHSVSWKNTPSIDYLEDGSYIQNPKALRIKDYSTIPSPYLEGVFDNLMRHNPHYKWMALWETNRGCPFKCTYCDWGSSTKSKLYTFETERLYKEIEWFARNKITFIYCCDSNFGILKRDLNIARYVADTKMKYGFPAFLSVHDTKNAAQTTYAIQELLNETGLSKGVSLALQTLDKTTLVNIRRQNISLKSFTELQQKFNCRQIETYTDIIIGLPGETYDSFTKGISAVIKMGQHNRIRFGPLSILPNSPMGDRNYQWKHGLVIVEMKTINQHSSLNSSEDGIYETQFIAVGTRTMPEKDWIKAREFSWWYSFLYFDKIIQIPLLLLQEIFGYSHREMIEAFFVEDFERYPITSEIQKFVYEKACERKECVESTEWLNLHWPIDEYIFIKLVVEDKMTGFYDEAEDILSNYLKHAGWDNQPFLHEALMLNRVLIKEPFQKKDLVCHMEYDIWELYLRAIAKKNATIEKGNYIYHIDRTSKVWATWDEWFREVVWYGNKKGAYLYRVKALENDLDIY